MTRKKRKGNAGRPRYSFNDYFRMCFFNDRKKEDEKQRH